MKCVKGKVIYVGKAKNLKKRLKQYFSGTDSRAMIPYLLKEIGSIKTIIVENEKEALLLENTLIKKHQPKYNATLKDDKTFISLMVTTKDPWPKLQLVRYKGKPKQKGRYFGPYTNAFAARQVFELLNKLFPLRQCSNSELSKRTRPCLLYGMKRCVAPCVNLCSKEEYNEFVSSAINFLEGKDTLVLDNLNKKMNAASEALEFEKAANYLKTIKQIEHVTKNRQVVQNFKEQNSDAIGFFREKEEVVLMQLFIRDGKLVGSEHHIFSQSLETDEELLISFILQYYGDKPSVPKNIFLPQRIQNLVEIQSLIGKKMKIITPQKGSKKKLVDLAKKNAQAFFTQNQNEQALQEKMLLDLSETLKLNRFPKRIECFDTSNISGTDLVASMVAFSSGKYDGRRTRFYNIKSLDKNDDYGALREVLTRRLRRAKQEEDLPDLILIDGGKGQLNVGLQVLKELDIAIVDIASVTKEKAKHTKGITHERVFIPGRTLPIELPPKSPTLFFLQRVRDATHEKAIKFHRSRRKKRIFSSVFEDIKGIGPIKKQRLLKHFGSYEQVQKATEEELSKIEGISKKDIQAIKNHG